MTLAPRSETDMLHMMIERAPFALPGIHLERRAIINERSARGHWLRNGVVGQADAFAVFAGKHIELETKAARGAMRKAQEAWRARCLEPPGGWPPLCPHLVLKAKKDETADETVGRWLEELRAALHV